MGDLLGGAGGDDPAAARPARVPLLLREGIAETLALLGSHGESLTACPNGRPQQVTYKVVNSLLAEANSRQWASLNDVLPLLAEASPDAFLSAVGGASEKPDEPFSGVFAAKLSEISTPILSEEKGELIYKFSVKEPLNVYMMVNVTGEAPFEKDDKIRAYINMGKYNDLSPIEISYNQLSDKEEAFKIEKIKHWKVASVYRINIEKGI